MTLLLKVHLGYVCVSVLYILLAKSLNHITAPNALEQSATSPPPLAPASLIAAKAAPVQLIGIALLLAPPLHPYDDTSNRFVGNATAAAATTRMVLQTHQGISKKNEDKSDFTKDAMIWVRHFA